MMNEQLLHAAIQQQGLPTAFIHTIIEYYQRLEAEDDAHGIWRSYVNQQLAEIYPILFAPIQHLIALQAPSFECVYAWRRLQEHKLAATDATDKTAIMNAQQLHRFIMHYERLSRFNLAVLPEQAWAVLELDAAHRIIGCKWQ